MQMKAGLSLVVLCLLVLGTQCARIRRQYGGYAQQYGAEYNLYGPGGQGWTNNNGQRYQNQQGYQWNTNFNWNQGNRRPEWYYNSSSRISSSMIVLLPMLCLAFMILE